MRERLLSYWKHVQNVLFYVVMACLSVLMVITVTARLNGETPTVFGYSSIYVLTGSMEPYMLTGSLCLSKEVNSIEDCSVGDVVTFVVYDDLANAELTITHRIIDISDDGIITTKGDNNSAADRYELSADSVKSEVVCVCNAFALFCRFLFSVYGFFTAIAGIFICMAYQVYTYKLSKEGETL